MAGASIILLINLAVAGLFCASFVLVAFYDPRYRSARWFAATYAMGMAYALVEFVLPTVANIKAGVFVGHMTFLATLVLLNIGLARRYQVNPPFLLLAGAAVIAVVAAISLLDLPRGALTRNFLYQGPYFLMQSVGLWIVLRAAGARPAGRRAIDTLLACFLGLSALHYLLKPFLVSALGGSGATARDYIGTAYAMVSQSMGTVLVVATGLLLIAMLILDVVRDITTRSETDSLSGLFNRRGFIERLEDLAARLPANGMPVTLVLCDLDRFKAVNDSWGHAAGDRVIAAFAATLREGAAGHHVLGRIGGEEFAALLPGSNLAAARLFAETVRSAFAGRAIEGVPPCRRFTASFGVAEMVPGETADSLIARADDALYEAKRAGRDRVRVGETAAPVAPLHKAQPQ